MKKKLKVVLGIVLFVFTILIIRVHTIPKTKVEPNIFQGGICILRKQESTKINYMCTTDRYTVYNFLQEQEWKKTEHAYLKAWIYSVTLSDMLKKEGHKGHWVTENSNDDERICKINIYDDCIEINGIFYKPDNYSEIYSFFENYYNECTNNWPVYTIER